MNKFVRTKNPTGCKFPNIFFQQFQTLQDDIARRYIALTASVKFRIGSPKTARNEQAKIAHQKECAPKVIQKVPKSFSSSCIQDGL